MRNPSWLYGIGPCRSCFHRDPPVSLLPIRWPSNLRASRDALRDATRIEAPDSPTAPG